MSKKSLSMLALAVLGTLYGPSQVLATSIPSTADNFAVMAGSTAIRSGASIVSGTPDSSLAFQGNIFALKSISPDHFAEEEVDRHHHGEKDHDGKGKDHRRDAKKHHDGKWKDFHHDAKKDHHFDLKGDGRGKDHKDNVAAVPVPAALWLFGSGLMGLIGIVRRSRRNSR